MNVRAPAWIEMAARFGFAAKGIVYLILGTLAVRAALGTGGDVTDPRGAVRAVLQGGYGRVLVGSLAVGLLAYAFWRFLEAFADANRKGRSARALVSRTGYAIKGVFYGSLGVYAGTLALRRPALAGDRSTLSGWMDGWTAEWMIPVAGLALIGYAAHQTWLAWHGRLDERLNVWGMSQGMRDISRIGIAARALVFAGIGALLVRSPARSAAAAADTGTSESLQWWAGLPSGRWGLLAIAVGVAAYGVYQLVHARYRRITPP